MASRLRDGFNKGTDGDGWKSAPPKPVKVWDADNLPTGYDPHVWYLATVFHGEAEENGVAYHRFEIYSAMLDRLIASGLMEQNCSSDEELARTFAAIQRHYASRHNGPLVEIPDRVLAGPKWRQFVELMIIVFWADVDRWTERGELQPLRLFYSRDGFIGLMDIVQSYMVASALPEPSEGDQCS